MPKADLTSVRTLITSATECARTCNISQGAVYRWIKVNRIPGKYLTKVCNLYDVELRDILPLTGSEESFSSPVLLKPRHTLDQALEIYLGKKAVEDVVDISPRAMKSILFHWGDQLPTLHATLKQLDEKRISIEDACKRLNVAKYTLHGIRRKYGYAPGKLKRTRPKSQINARREMQYRKALEVIAGKVTAKDAATQLNISYRTIFRAIDKISDVSLNDLSHWPRSFRWAFSEEIDKKLPNYSKKWLEFAKKHRLFLPEYPKYPKTPDIWSNLPLKRLLVGVLMDEGTLEAVAVSRKADPVILASLFTSDLHPLDLTFEQVMELPVAHHVALAELLLAVMDRRRVAPDREVDGRKVGISGVTVEKNDD